MDTGAIMARMEEELRSRSQTRLCDANAVQLHEALAGAVMHAISEDWLNSRAAHAATRRAYYVSAEYLVGRMIYNNLYCLGILDEIRALLGERGVDIANMEDIEDMALGNGGLGRLAACFLDSAATHDLPLDGYGLRYGYGLFKQRFENGFQVEKADNWQNQGDPWSLRREDEAVTVTFADQKVIAVPYDMPVIGYKTANVSTLRLWQSEPVEEFDFKLFNDQQYAQAVAEKDRAEDITRVLYPNDSTDEGKRLRLKQQYLLSSATLQDIIRRYKRTHGSDMTGFAQHCAVQLNDTHPTVSIPELIRLLMLEGLDFDSAFGIAHRVFGFTNHTIMSEALEKWNIGLFNSVLPEIGSIIERINARLNQDLDKFGVDGGRRGRMQIIADGVYHMARLAIYVSDSVNGVAKLHTEILKNDVFADWYAVYPSRFRCITNGITQRRWLGLCDGELASLISGYIGDGFLKELGTLERIKPSIGDGMAARFNEIKLAKKTQLAEIISKREGVRVAPESIFDVQVKRLHEYKRQLMNAFSIMDIYYSIKDGSLRDFTPTTFIFGAKAAPGYAAAKAIIKYVNEVARLINGDSAMKDLMSVVFVQNYNCSYAEHIIPAADISEQISAVGTEASGTGNMKFMLNGTVTLGTYDGANIEIAECAGGENNYLFGVHPEDMAHIGASYNPRGLYDSNARIRRAVDTLVNGTVSDGGSGIFSDLYNSLVNGSQWQRADRYYVLYDLMPYIDTKLRANRDYRDRLAFGKKCLLNMASAGNFSSDRAIRQYSDEVWHITQLKD